MFGSRYPALVGKTVPASPGLLVRFAALALVGLPLGAALANALPDDSVAAQLAALAGVACTVPFLLYGFRFVNNAVVRMFMRDS